MKIKYIITLVTVLMLLTQSCGGNKDAELAFKAAGAGMSETNVSLYADNAFTELSDLNTKDACMLTLAYYYLYRNHYTSEYGHRFGKCYEYAIGRDLAEANDYFNTLTEMDDAASMIKNGYDNIEIMEQASDTFREVMDMN